MKPCSSSGELEKPGLFYWPWSPFREERKGVKEANKMKALKILLTIILTCITIGEIVVLDAFAETRTLTTMIMITIKAPESQTAPAPIGLEELSKVALVQSLNQRSIKVEDPINTPTGLLRYTMSEKL